MVGTSCVPIFCRTFEERISMGGGAHYPIFNHEGMRSSYAFAIICMMWAAPRCLIGWDGADTELGGLLERSHIDLKAGREGVCQREGHDLEGAWTSTISYNKDKISAVRLDVEGGAGEALYEDNAGGTIASVKSQEVRTWEVRVLRGPYLQMVGPHSAVVRWRTNVPVRSALSYGLDIRHQPDTVWEVRATAEHEVMIQGLDPHMRYYYALHGAGRTYLPADSGLYIRTALPLGSRSFVRVWVLGDAGTGTVQQRRVRDAYYRYVDTAAAYAGQTDMILMLGDNAYYDGKDREYQHKVFEVYDDIFRHTPIWPTLGNHDGHSADSRTQTGPYYEIFHLPTEGQLGGEPSGTEAYYSFDYANIHFVVLETYYLLLDRDQRRWLERDLQSTDQDWIVVYFHFPPYTKGSHDSDIEPPLIAVRSQLLPLLERYGVDLVLSGHSHSYERSYFLRGHYGFSFSFEKSKHTVGPNGGGLGNPTADDGPYVKMGRRSEGTVYVVCGSSGKKSRGSLNHPAMATSLYALGSCVLEFEALSPTTLMLRVQFVDQRGTVRDAFAIRKELGTTGVRELARPSFRIAPNPAYSCGMVRVYADQRVLSTWLVGPTGTLLRRSRHPYLILQGVPTGYYTLWVKTAKGASALPLLIVEP